MKWSSFKKNDKAQVRMSFAIDAIGEHRAAFWSFVLGFIFGTVEGALHGGGWTSWVPGLFIGGIVAGAIQLALVKLRE